jgi:hypothetical protein
MIDQRLKRARPDILAADQPQPIDPLLVGQPDVLIADLSPFLYSPSPAALGPSKSLPMRAYPKSKICTGS